MGTTDQIIGVESGGDPTARNPRSSAAGLGQFIDATWLDMLSRHRPDIKGSREERLALKSDPALSRAMTEAYAADNGAVLSSAGLPVNAGTTYLAHFAGPQGAINVLKADPSAPINEILGASAVAANPFLKGMKAGDLVAWAERKMGSRQPSAAQTLPASPIAPAMDIPTMPLAAAPEQPQGLAPDASMQVPDTPMQVPPIFAPPRKPPDLRALRAALARPPAGLFFGRG